MAKYTPLPLDSPAEHDEDDEFSPLKTGGHVSHQPGKSFNEKKCTPLVWLTILMAVAAILAAAMLHITVLSATPHLEPLRSPKDLISTLEMVTPDSYLQEGRSYVKQWIHSSESR
jgi:hypothetical protein